MSSLTAYDRRVAAICRMLDAVVVTETEHEHSDRRPPRPPRTGRPLMVPYSPDDHR